MLKLINRSNRTSDLSTVTNFACFSRFFTSNLALTHFFRNARNFTISYSYPPFTYVIMLYQTHGYMSLPKRFLVFYFPFSQFPTVISSTFFLKFVFFLSFIRQFLKCCSIFDALAHKLWLYYQLNGFKLTGMVYYNHSSLFILANHAKYIHFYPTFQLSTALSHGNYKPFIKSANFYLFRFKL